MESEKKTSTSIKPSIQKEIDNLTNDNIEKRINNLSERYVFHAERVSNDMDTISKIQNQVIYCIEVLQSRGVQIEMPPTENDVNAKE